MKRVLRRWREDDAAFLREALLVTLEPWQEWMLRVLRRDARRRWLPVRRIHPRLITESIVR